MSHPYRVKRILLVACLITLMHRQAYAAEQVETPKTQQEKELADEEAKKQFAKEATKASPSFQEKNGPGRRGRMKPTSNTTMSGPPAITLGFGENGNINENYLDFRHQFMRHTLLAFLVQGGFEYQHMGFGVRNNAQVPDRLDEALVCVGIDFRWSDKDLLHIEGRPGWYTDWQGGGLDAINSPLDIGYTRVTNKRFQWVVGVSMNSWRHMRYLGAAGFRWQINERWKIKAYLPQPDIEYVARPNLTLTLGADVRGDTYRVGPHFGDARGVPALNNALVDYQEVRLGPGFSWNVKPTIEMNFMAGYIAGRQFDYFNRGPKLNGSSAPL